jgi:UDP-GlcNAc:undecaprenyl-phosphate/decaprenyl-phosphate GlcNAc-1-phosphate transferase
MNWPLEIAVVIAVGTSLAATFLARSAALHFHWLDQPSHRKVHANPIPLLGGVAMYLAFLLSVLVTNSQTVFKEGATVLVGATLLLVVGIVDDRRGLSPLTKLLAQVSAAVLLVVSGIGVRFLPFPWLDLLATILWVAAICNAMNLLDNMDGLSAGVAAIACAFFTLLALWHGQIWVSIVAAVLVGATIGFLRFNWNPATIFMGDAGSLLLGFLLAVLAIKLRFPQVDPQRTWPIPLLILAVPIFDTTLVTISRLRRGVPISSGGRDHVSHRLVRLGLSVRQAVATIYLVAILCGGAAISALLVPGPTYVYGLVALIGLAGLFALVALERVELTETGQVARSHRRFHVTRLKALGSEPIHHISQKETGIAGG